jgi:hypothetical protein
MAPIITQCSLALSWALLTEAGLSFLGLGTQPPNSSIGVMLNESRKLMEIAPWLLLYPGIAITLGVLGFNLLGELDRFQIYYVVLGVWLFQLIVSPIWLRYFRFGPAEWLWRSLTYKNKQQWRLQVV